MKAAADLARPGPRARDLATVLASPGNAAARPAPSAPGTCSAFAPPAPVIASVFTARLPTSVIDLTGVIGKLLHGRTGRCKHNELWNPSCRPWLLSAFSGGQWTQSRIFQLAKDDPDASNLCQLCGAAEGTAQHRFSCPATLPDQGWPRPNARIEHFTQRLEQPRRSLLDTRGLLVLNLHIPERHPTGWMHWFLCPPPDVPETATFYIDGSLLDGPSELISRCGLAICIVDEHDELLAYGHGVPPDWVRTSGAAEAWALYMVMRMSPTLPRVITDCLNLLQTLERGFKHACGPARPQARLWRLIAGTFDYAFQPEWIHKRLLWMPSHSSKAAIGTAIRSDGVPITPTDWRCNRLVDALAKGAAHSQRVPPSIRFQVQDAKDALEHAAAQLGVVTKAANTQTTTQWREDGTTFQRRLRDSLPPPRKAQAERDHEGTDQRAPPHPRTGTAEPRRDSEDAEAERAYGRKAAWHRGAAARTKTELQTQAAAEEARFLRTWHHDMAGKARNPVAGPGRPSAGERMRALRERIRARSP